MSGRWHSHHGPRDIKVNGDATACRDTKWIEYHVSQPTDFSSIAVSQPTVFTIKVTIASPRSSSSLRPDYLLIISVLVGSEECGTQSRAFGYETVT